MLDKEDVTKALIRDMKALIGAFDTGKRRVKVEGDHVLNINDVFVDINKKIAEIEPWYKRKDVLVVLRDMHEKMLFRVYPQLFQFSGIDVTYLSGKDEIRFYTNSEEFYFIFHLPSNKDYLHTFITLRGNV